MRGITILSDILGSFHTGDADMVQEEKIIGMPEVQTVQVQVPGRNGLLNLTSGLTGRPCYNNRLLNFRYFLSAEPAYLEEVIFHIGMLHGTQIAIIDDDSPQWLYVGEAKFEFERHGNYMIVMLEVDALPFRYAIDETIKTVTLTNTTKTKNLSIDYYGQPVVPAIVTDKAITITKGDRSVQVTAGTYTDLTEFTIGTGSNEFIISGSGAATVKFSYREACI